ncbi:hypothetical protein AAMO2058_000532600 [Amorphochlora amoebiformis]
MSKFLQQRQMEARLTAEGEDFVFMSAFTYSDSKRKIVLVLGSKNYFEFDGEVIDLHEELPQARSYLGLDTAEENPTDSKQFIIFQCMKPAIRLSGSESDVMEAVVVLNTLIRDAWQQACEEYMIVGREVYQFHANLRKVNRKKKAQDRIFVVSNAFIYNLEEVSENVRIEEFKWSMPIASLLHVAAGRDDPRVSEYPATLHFDLNKAKEIKADKSYKERKEGSKKSVNDKHQLLFSSQFARDRFTMALLALYYAVTKTHLTFDRTNSGTGLRKSQLGHIRKQGVLMKYTRGALGRVGKHPRFVQIKSTGTISWGKTKETIKYSEAIIGVNDKGAIFKQFKISDDDLKRFFCVLTSGKSVYLLCETEEDKKEWMNAIEVLSQANKISIEEREDMRERERNEIREGEISGRYQRDIRMISERYQGDIREISGRYQRDIGEISERYRGDIREISRRYQRDIREISERYRGDIREISGRYQRDIREISERYQLDIREISGRYQRDIGEISERYQGDIRVISGRYQRDIREISERYQGDIREISDRRENG